MDIIDRIIDEFLGTFSPAIESAELEAFKRELRVKEGGQKHYAYSAAAYDHLDIRRRVFALMQEGMNTAQIAERVGRAQRTVQDIIARKPLA